MLAKEKAIDFDGFSILTSAPPFKVAAQFLLLTIQLHDIYSLQIMSAPPQNNNKGSGSIIFK